MICTVADVTDQLTMFFLLTLVVAAVAAEECTIICNANWDPVCGSDGK